MGDVDDGSGGVGGDDVYRGRTKPALVSVLDLYSEDEIISICDSRPFSSPAYTATDYLFTGYCSKEIVCDFDLRRSFYSKPVF